MLIYEKPWNVVLCLSAINPSILPKKFFGFLLLFFNYFRVLFLIYFLFLYFLNFVTHCFSTTGSKDKDISQYKTFAVFLICFAISLVAFI